MKIVKLDGNTVREVIPEYALPVEKFYGAAFAAQCVEAPDEVGQRWILNEDGSWTNPENVVEPEPEPTQLDRVEAQVTYTAMMTDTLLEV